MALAIRTRRYAKPSGVSRTPSILSNYLTARCNDLRAFVVMKRHCATGDSTFRPLSGDGFDFGVSNFPAGVLAFSRILNDRELLIVANSNTESGFIGEVIVDFSLNPIGSTYEVLFTNNTTNDGGVAPGPVIEKAVGDVEIREVNGTLTTGPARILRVTLQKMELQILGQTSRFSRLTDNLQGTNQ